MSKKFKSPKMKVAYGLSIALTIIVMGIVSCTKDTETTLNQENGSNNNMAKITAPNATLGILENMSSTPQPFTISCTCTGSFTLGVSPYQRYLNYGATTSTTLNLKNVDISINLTKNVYYYVIPTGLSYGGNTKCLKLKFKTFNAHPLFQYNPATNTWNNLQNNTNVDASQVNKSVVPACTPC